MRRRASTQIRAKSPTGRFRRWFDQARRRGADLPEASVLATSTSAGRPSARFVLLKQADERGFVFFTSSRSRKGRELAANPFASLVFYWHETGRQVRVEGRIFEVENAEADAYWVTRPRASQLAAAVSAQSAPLASRRELVERVARLRRHLHGRPVPRPAHWTGYRLRPERIEFWIHRAHRLHERELVERAGKGWRRTLLQP